MINRSVVFRLSIMVIFLAASLAAVLFLDLKAQAIRFHTRDYPFFLQFAAKLLDPELPNRFSINPNGFNYLGYVGTEGALSFHQSIHLEPVRYFYAAAFTLTGKPVSLFAFYALFYLLPVLYVAYAFPAKRKLDSWFFLLFVLLFVLHPLSLSAIADDLRPRHLMTSAFMLSFLAIHWQRNWFEKLAFFGLLLFTREEAAILAVGLIFYEVIRARSFNHKRTMAALFVILWLACLWIQYRYFIWTGYETSQDLTLQQTFINLLEKWRWVALLVAGLTILAFVFRARVQRLFRYPPVPTTGIYALMVMPPLLVQFYREEAKLFESLFTGSGLISISQSLFFSPKNSLLFAASLLLVYQIWDAVQTGRTRRWILFIIGGALLISSAVGINRVVRDVSEFRAIIPDVQILIDLRAVTDNLKTPILTDYETNQAFYDYDQMFVFERLPSYVLSGDERFYPSNLPALKDLVENKVEWVAITAKSKDTLLPMFEEGQINPQIIAENNRFIVLRLR